MGRVCAAAAYCTMAIGPDSAGPSAPLSPALCSLIAPCGDTSPAVLCVVAEDTRLLGGRGIQFRTHIQSHVLNEWLHLRAIICLS